MTFKVLVQPSGHEFTLDANESLLDAALNQGLNLPYGCRNGACGSCVAQLLSGEVDYGDRAVLGLSDSDREAGKILCCQAHAASDLEIKAREINSTLDIKPRIIPARVVELNPLSHDVMQMKLKLPESQRMQFMAGQYIEFLLKDGKRRAFSIANAPHEDEFIELHIRHVPGGYFSSHVFDEMKEKALVRIEGPFGGFYLREESDRPIILMGGGTGYAPLRGMLEHAMALKMKNPIHLFCGVRAKRDLYMQQEVATLQQQYPQLKFTPVLSEPQTEDSWQGATGYVHEAVIAEYNDLSAFDIYMSGPPPMVNAAQQAFMQHGANEDQLYSDAFEYSADAQQATKLN